MNDDRPGAPERADTLGGIGEAGVLRRILPLLPASDATVLGPGDDAAVLAAASGRYVVTTDMMIEGPDFRRAWSSPEDLGWKAAASNLADVAAMGAKPTALVVALAAPADTPVADLEGLARGLRAGCDELAPGCGVVGGDLSVSSVFTIAVTAMGEPVAEPVTRSAARPGDVLALAGEAGSAAAGLRMLFAHGIDAAGAPDRERALELRRRHPETVGAQLRPRPPIAAGVAAALAGVHAMMDVSDGLALDASRLADASGVAIDFDSAALGDDPALALAGGEDHALLAAFPPDAALPAAFRVIGRVAAGSGIAVDGEPHDPHGWDPYAPELPERELGSGDRV